jgi:hypothetical protein
MAVVNDGERRRSRSDGFRIEERSRPRAFTSVDRPLEAGSRK